MKKIEDLKKYKEMKDSDLKAEILKQRTELTLLSLKIKAGKAGNMSEINKKRKGIARMQTILNERLIK